MIELAMTMGVLMLLSLIAFMPIVCFTSWSCDTKRENGFVGTVVHRLCRVMLAHFVLVVLLAFFLPILADYQFEEGSEFVDCWVTSIIAGWLLAWLLTVPRLLIVLIEKLFVVGCRVIFGSPKKRKGDPGMEFSKGALGEFNPQSDPRFAVRGLANFDGSCWR